MNVRRAVLALVFCLAGLAVCCAADDPNMGTWKLNEAKSKYPAGVTKNTTVSYTQAGDQVKVTTDGTTADGKPAHTEWTGKFDGQDYPLTGDPTANTRSYKKINERTMMLTNKKDGKDVATGRIEIAKDGKSRTIRVEATMPDGKKMKYMGYYDKQ